MSLLSALRNAHTCWEVELSLTLCMCEEVNTPHSLAIFIAIQNHEWVELKNLAPNPACYLDRRLPWINKGPNVFRLDRQVSRMLVKSNEMPTGIDTESDALDTFCQIEAVLQKQVYSPRLNAPWLLELSNEVNRILSPDCDQPFLNSKVMEAIISNMRLGPGTTLDVSGRFIQSDKLRFPSSVSPRLLPFAESIKGSVWHNEQPRLAVYSWAKVICVPKNAWTSRTIMQNPTVDLSLQLGLASVLRDRLKRVGIDLSDQGRNQNLAKRARDLNLATIDLKSASSWFCARNLEEILPPDLMHLIDLFRPHQYVIPGVQENPVELLNWLPMGCGHTFPLMTIYLVALARIIVPKSAHSLIGVYGDDIILPQKYCKEMINRLEYLGIQVNVDKSCLSGNFFESCGAEFFAGNDVRPFYCRRGKEDSNSPVPYRVQLANKLRLWSKTEGGCLRRWKPIWDALLKKVDRDFLLPVPPSFGDTGIIMAASESGIKSNQLNGWDRAYDVRHLMYVGKSSRREDPFPYMSWLMSRMQNNEMDASTLYIKHKATLHLVRNDVRMQIRAFGAVLEPDVLPPSFGFEPIRGLYGKVLSKVSRTLWDDGLAWL